MGIGAPASGPGNPDVLSFAQIENFISNNSATEVYDSTTASAYCYSGLVWIGYDNEQSVAVKVDYVKQNGLLGYFFWNVVQDNNWALSMVGKINFNLVILLYIKMVRKRGVHHLS